MVETRVLNARNGEKYKHKILWSKVHIKGTLGRVGDKG